MTVFNCSFNCTHLKEFEAEKNMANGKFVKMFDGALMTNQSRRKDTFTQIKAFVSFWQIHEAMGKESNNVT